jgi:hypothetical protein
VLPCPKKEYTVSRSGVRHPAAKDGHASVLIASARCPSGRRSRWLSSMDSHALSKTTFLAWCIVFYKDISMLEVTKRDESKVGTSGAVTDAPWLAPNSAGSRASPLSRTVRAVRRLLRRSTAGSRAGQQFVRGTSATGPSSIRFADLEGLPIGIARRLPITIQTDNSGQRIWSWKRHKSCLRSSVCASV